MLLEHYKQRTNEACSLVHSLSTSPLSQRTSSVSQLSATPPPVGLQRYVRHLQLEWKRCLLLVMVSWHVRNQFSRRNFCYVFPYCKAFPVIIKTQFSLVSPSAWINYHGRLWECRLCMWIRKIIIRKYISFLYINKKSISDNPRGS